MRFGQPIAGLRFLKRGHGFVLVELAVGTLVIALLIGSIVVPLSTQVEKRKVEETRKTLTEVRDALLGYAIINGYLPCPDKMATGATPGTANDGVEDRNGAACSVDEGNLPWVTLATAASDSWNNRFRYRVDASFAQSSTLTYISTSGIHICGESTCAVDLSTSDGPPAVFLSHGKNGFGAMSATTNLQNPAPTSADELQNTNGNLNFVDRVHTAADTTAGEFDDIVEWIPHRTMFNRVVAAGKMP